MHFNVTRLNEANVKITKEFVFHAPTTTNLTTDSLDYYLHQTLSRSPENNVRYRFNGHSRGIVTIELFGTSFILDVPRPSFNWCVGYLGPGGQLFEADPDEVQTLLDRLCYILQRLKPVKIDAGYRYLFLRSIFNRLIRHADSTFKLKAVTDGFNLRTLEPKT